MDGSEQRLWALLLPWDSLLDLPQRKIDWGWIPRQKENYTMKECWQWPLLRYRSSFSLFSNAIYVWWLSIKSCRLKISDSIWFFKAMILWLSLLTLAVLVFKNCHVQIYVWASNLGHRRTHLHLGLKNICWQWPIVNARHMTGDLAFIQIAVCGTRGSKSF